ncbi:MAG TPA: heme biosynthesis HemY N-terminal domain-containing protein [Aliidongia sp.]|uniref:heme biosynthesis protein HemY n=1 Tax=Aliidongia sp. TaxID=1914230 RepID=UPI002DDDA6A1|nr:heme biosynthesis HemY N-terminal domain-containing protein [Aliidongia sp.]HEV2677821.1 heme biosynthesis HemY N-terminal domain-containing protein [Aliidongia sp.]
MRRALRILPAIVLIIVVVAAAVFFADRPGTIGITWLGWRIEMALGVAVLALVVLVTVLWFLLSLLARLTRAPRHLAGRRRDQRRLEGYRALTSGLVAVAAGDARAAERLHKRAELMFRKGQLDSPPLTRLLSAQAALMRGDSAMAEGEFSAMLGDPETEFLGLRGLILQALKRGDDATALKLTTRANELKPSTAWVLQSQLALETRAQEWRKATATLKQAVKKGAISAETGRHYQATLLIAHSRRAAGEGLARDALSYAAQAHGLDDGFAPAATHYARLLRDGNRAAKGLRALETAWVRTGHPQVAEAYDQLLASEAPVQRLKRFERLVELRPSDPESHLAAAAIALNARLWGEARRHLGHAGAQGPGPWSGRLSHLMAELEQGEHGNGEARQLWLERAVRGEADPTWVCGACGAETHGWEPLCPSCHNFDSLAWRTPDRTEGTRADRIDILPPGETTILDPTAPATASRDGT